MCAEAFGPDKPDEKSDSMSINISAYRLLYIYQLLSQYEQISFEELNAYLLDHVRIQRTFSNETLSKYIQTLRLFGCRIERLEDWGKLIYSMEEHPLKVQLTANETKVIRTVATFLSCQPVSTLYSRFCCLVKRLSAISFSPEEGTAAEFETMLEPGLSKQDCLLLEQFKRNCYE